MVQWTPFGTNLEKPGLSFKYGLRYSSPISRRTTLASVSAMSRHAATHPAVPAPTTMYSHSDPSAGPADPVRISVVTNPAPYEFRAAHRMTTRLNGSFPAPPRCLISHLTGH